MSRGFYAQQIERLLAQFPREQLLVLRSDELKDRHEATLLRIYDFLGVKNRAVMASPEIVFAASDSVPVSRVATAALRKRFRRSITALEQLLGWELKPWKG